MKEGFRQNPSPMVLTDALTHRSFWSGYFLNTTDDEDKLLDTREPLDLEVEIYYGAGDGSFEGVFNEGSEINTPVEVVWKDGNNADGLRPEKLTLSYMNNGSTETSSTIVSSDLWKTTVSGETTSIAPDWELLGDEAIGYRYEVTGELGKGFTVTMYHAPQTTVTVAGYAESVFTDKNFYNSYIADMTAELGNKTLAEERYSQLLTLVITMLEYGAYAQTAFDRNAEELANGGEFLFTDKVKSDMIKSDLSDMTEDLERYGLEYQYSTVLYLSKTSLRHYYTITDSAKFNAVKDNITFDGKNVTPVRKGELIFFELQSVAACRLDYQYVLKIGDNEYKYSVMDFTKLLLDSGSDKKVIELAKSTYRFSQAANLYFESFDVPGETSTVNGSVYLRGDANRDGAVNVKDVTAIQRFLSQMQPGTFNEKAADVDGSGIDISDATNIQRRLAEFYDPYNVNELVIIEADPAQSEYESSFVPK